MFDLHWSLSSLSPPSLDLSPVTIRHHPEFPRTSVSPPPPPPPHSPSLEVQVGRDTCGQETCKQTEKGLAVPGGSWRERQRTQTHGGLLLKSSSALSFHQSPHLCFTQPPVTFFLSLAHPCPIKKYPHPPPFCLSLSPQPSSFYCSHALPCQRSAPPSPGLSITPFSPSATLSHTNLLPPFPSLPSPILFHHYPTHSYTESSCLPFSSLPHLSILFHHPIPPPPTALIYHALSRQPSGRAPTSVQEIRDRSPLFSFEPYQWLRNKYYKTTLPGVWHCWVLLRLVGTVSAYCDLMRQQLWSAASQCSSMYDLSLR